MQLTDDQRDIQQRTKDLAAKFPDEYWEERDRLGEFPWEFYRAFAEGGWLGMSVPEEYGGGGLGLVETSLMVQEIAASGACLNGVSSLALGVYGVKPIVHHGSDELKRRFLPGVATGDLHVSFGITEPDAGSDSTAITTRARKVPGGYVVSGRKVWTSRAQEAHRIMLLVRTSPRPDDTARRAEGLTLLFVEVDRSKMSITNIPRMGRNAVDTNEVVIDELFVPEEDRVGEEGEGFKYLLSGLNAERILISHMNVGIGEAALSRAVKYAQDRVVFGRPIGMNQGIQFPLARARVLLDGAELAARNAAVLYDDGRPCGREANGAKYLSAEACYFAADTAVQVHGGFGYAREFHVERYFREARLQRIAPVSQELVLSFVGTKVLGLPRSY